MPPSDVSLTNYFFFAFFTVFFATAFLATFFTAFFATFFLALGIFSPCANYALCSDFIYCYRKMQQEFFFFLFLTEITTAKFSYNLRNGDKS
ncbi:MAG: hypothetical protein COX65_10075 [Elusimicrobia bacterium CG_4_10_14_0_2_um_filter_56_8]|nr:MAG: hypothetical protein COX65_10075 [Elusimicrobia bacterium CG_4_10_14_0_2_um_filter_56_8]